MPKPTKIPVCQYNLFQALLRPQQCVGNGSLQWGRMIREGGFGLYAEIRLYSYIFQHHEVYTISVCVY